MDAHEFYVSTLGNDCWSGRLPEPNADLSDGPFATLAGARDALRILKATDSWPGPVTVWIRGGRYPLREPLLFTPADSAPVTYAAYTGETPVIDGGRRITGWRAERVNGANANGANAWVADVPTGIQFRQLFVNGRRASRSRLPKVAPGTDGRDAFFRMAGVPNVHFGDTLGTTDLFDGCDRFVAQPGDVRPWRNLQDAEVVVVHYWIEERMPVASFDEASGTVVSRRHSMFALKDDFVPPLCQVLRG